VKVSYRIFELGDEALTLELDGATIDSSTSFLLITMKAFIDRDPFDGFRDTVLGYRSITITYDLFRLASKITIEHVPRFVRQKLEDALHFSMKTPPKFSGRHVKIPVCYDRKFALDMDHLCTTKNISADELISIHTNQSYHVYLVGFLPGFPYLGFVDQKLEAPRLSSPRANVPAGSVGIAGRQTGIYPLDSPGGWQIIGRTPLRIFQPEKNPPVVAEVGDTVSFFPISIEEFNRIQTSSP
jgi:inhibitor of KinA